MTTPVAGSFWKVTARYNKGKEGWSETYWSTAASAAALQTAMGPLLLARLMLLPAGASLAYCHGSQPGTPRDSQPLYSTALSGTGTTLAAWGATGLDGSLTTPPTVATTPKTEVCITLRAGTAGGAWSNSFVRCLPSAEFADDAIVPSLVSPAPVGGPVTAFATPITAGAMIATWPAAFSNYMAGVFANTVYATKKNAIYFPSGPTGLYDTEPWAYIIVNSIGTRKTGRPFKAPVGRRILR